MGFKFQCVWKTEKQCTAKWSQQYYKIPLAFQLNQVFTWCIRTEWKNKKTNLQFMWDDFGELSDFKQNSTSLVWLTIAPMRNSFESAPIFTSNYLNGIRRCNGSHQCMTRNIKYSIFKIPRKWIFLIFLIFFKYQQVVCPVCPHWIGTFH